MKKAILILITFILNMYITSADGHDLSEAEAIIQNKISCDKLTSEQLELLGEHYMEQMHPGEAHEIMDEMMGGEGSESLKQMHVQMAKRLYCNEDTGGMMGGGMMGMMPMMGGGPMANYGYGYGMMEGMMYPYGYWNFWSILGVLIWIGVFALIFWLIYTIVQKGARPKETPLEILKKRFARGEVSKKEFEEMKKELTE